MLALLVRIYRFFFAKQYFYKLNKLIYKCALSGLGVLNYESNKISGEAAFLKSYFFMRPGGIVLDVGANLGSYSKLVLSSNPTAILYAFEPHPKTYKSLTEGLFGENIHTINAGVSNENGNLILYDYADLDGSSHASLYKGVIEEIHKSNPIEHEIQIIKLDDFLSNRDIEKISLLKIDTEGNEFKVLQGISEYLNARKIQAIHFEFNEMNVVSRKYFKDFWNFLYMYDFYRLLPGSMVKIEEYNPVFCEIFAYQNIVAILKRDE